ncbi:MAG: DoxX family protein [Gammaproteobacteria bacterium]|nr:DoxX family protein [Gammaproteobacteria bacterium]
MNRLLNALREQYDRALRLVRPLDGVAPLLLRLILAPVMIQAGWTKLAGFEGTVRWFEGSLGLPLPELMVVLVIGAEFVGGILLLVGLATRLVAIPLMVTMLVAAFAVHWENGWLAISDASSWLANDRVMEAAERKAEIRSILRKHGDYRWLTGRGSVTILNNGIEFAAMYFVMLLSLFFTGGGRFTSLDHWLARLSARMGKPTQLDDRAALYS